MFGIGTFEVVVILLVALIVFGPQQLPKVAVTLAKSWREFNRALQDVKDQVKEGLDELEKQDGERPRQAPPAAPAAGAPAALTTSQQLRQDLVRSASNPATRPSSQMSPTADLAPPEEE